MTHSALRAGLALLAAGAGMALAGCGQASGAGAPSSAGLGQAVTTPGGSSASQAGATLDPSLQAALNQIGNQITEVGNDLQSASATPGGDPSQ